MGIAERNAQKDTIDKYLRQYWGDYPHLATSLVPGKNLRERVNNFVGQIVKMAQEDRIELKPADVARRAADHLADQERPGIHWRTMDDHRKGLGAGR